MANVFPRLAYQVAVACLRVNLSRDTDQFSDS